MHVDFNWNGGFGYTQCKKDNFSLTEPIPSPMMTGEAFVIQRENFWRLGGYDPGMYGWGGENYELSFKAWLCGGSVDLISCSHVAHLDRSFAVRTYANPEGGYTKNMFRVTEVWTDEYRSTFNSFLQSSKPSDLKLDDRFMLTRTLQCKQGSLKVM